MGSPMTKAVCPKRTLREWSPMLKNSKTRSKKVTKKPAWTNVMRPLPGWMPTKLPRLMNSKTNRRKLRPFATPSSPSCIKLLVVQVECPVVCLEVCQVACLVLVELEVPLEQDPDQLSRKSTKSEKKNSCIYISHFMISLHKQKFKDCNSPLSTALK